METGTALEAIFLVFTGAAVLATLALWARQALLVAYIVLGVAIGPAGLGWVDDARWLAGVSQIGIMFLLYLLGLDLAPRQLWRMLGEATGVTLASSLAFAAAGLAVAVVCGFTGRDALLVAAASMFSSTIIGLKLLPTTTLHHRHTGQIIISVLLLQDLIAITVLLLVQAYGSGGEPWSGIVRQLLVLPLLLVVAQGLERFVVEPLLRRFDQIREYVFLVVIAWCLGLAQLAHALGLSHEIGAFVAGVALASSPVALFITESLKPLRDFFLILFFFSLGAGFDLTQVGGVAVPALALAAMLLVVKPLVFRWLLIFADERPDVSLEIGVRLGQVSEFSLLIAVLAASSGFASEQASALVQLTTLLTFLVSSYLIVLRYPTPIAVSDRLRRD